jgi:hypothetical protein
MKMEEHKLLWGMREFAKAPARKSISREFLGLTHPTNGGALKGTSRRRLLGYATYFLRGKADVYIKLKIAVLTNFILDLYT